MNIKKDDSEELSAAIIAAIGRPLYYHSTKCTKVSENTCRVNVYTSKSTGALSVFEIVASYFVYLDDSRNIIESEPELKRIF
jgi:hypothetical protein